MKLVVKHGDKEKTYQLTAKTADGTAQSSLTVRIN